MEERQTDFVARCQASLESREVAVGLLAETAYIYTRAYVYTQAQGAPGRPIDLIGIDE